MPKITRINLRKLFEKGARPAQEAFFNWQDSFWHKDDLIDVDAVKGLQSSLNNKLDVGAQDTILGAFNSFKSEVTETVKTGYIAYLKKTDTRPVDGWKPGLYKLIELGYYANLTPAKDKDGNATNIVSVDKKINEAFWNGAFWTKSEINLPGVTAKPIFDPVNNIDASTMQATAGYINSSLGENVSDYVSQTIGASVSDYLNSHINDFNFNQPNYVQANSSFDFSSITSVMNDKFISIIEDIDLQGQTIDFLVRGITGLKLVFNGGRLLNGKIKPNKTTCVFNDSKAFQNVEILGRFENEFVYPEYLGAKFNGTDDSFAINQCLMLSAKTICQGNRIATIKHPLIIPVSNTELFVDKGFTIKLGDKANCTVLMNKNVTYPKDADLNVMYPQGAEQMMSNIRLSGTGTIDCNGWMQFRDSPEGNGVDVPAFKNNPDVAGTPTQSYDGQTPYWGAALIFADIFNLNISGKLRIRNPRTYGLLFGNIWNYNISGLFADRTYKQPNGDFLHFHGGCMNGNINNLEGVSADDFIAITTKEAGNLTLRKGSVDQLTIDGCIYYGIDPNATPTNPVEINRGLVDNFMNHRFLRLSYTNDFIRGIKVSNCTMTAAEFVGFVVLSNLPFNPPNNGRNGYGTGKIFDVSFENIRQTSARGFIDTSDYLECNEINVKNCDFISTNMNVAGGLLIFNEDFTDNPNAGAFNSLISNFNVDGMKVYKGPVHPLPNGFINYDGIIANIRINNMICGKADDVPYLWELFIRAKVLNMTLSNCVLPIFNKIFSLGNNDATLFEDNNIYKNDISETQVFERIQNKTLPVSGLNAMQPKLGDIILVKGRGSVVFTTEGWNDLTLKKVVLPGGAGKPDATDLNTAIELSNELKNTVNVLLAKLKEAGISIN